MKGASFLLLRKNKAKHKHSAARRGAGQTQNLTYTTSNEEANVRKQPEEVNKCPSVLSKIRSW